MSALQSKAKRSRAKPARRVRVLGSRASALRLHQKICTQAKPSASTSRPRLTRRGFRDADFFGASSVASALDRCTGRDPDTLSPHHSMTDLPPCYRNTGTQISLKERTCPIYARQVKQHGIREMHRQ